MKKLQIIALFTLTIGWFPFMWIAIWGSWHREYAVLILVLGLFMCMSSALILGQVFTQKALWLNQEEFDELIDEQKNGPKTLEEIARGQMTYTEVMANDVSAIRMAVASGVVTQKEFLKGLKDVGEVGTSLTKNASKELANTGQVRDTVSGLIGDMKTLFLDLTGDNKSTETAFKDYLYNLPSKVIATKEIIDKFPVKTIVFSESTKFVDDLYDLLPNIAVKYHSNMESQIIDGKKYGAKKLRDLAIKKIKDNRYKERVIISAKSLNEGFDVPDIMLGIRSSFTRNPATARQIRGKQYLPIPA
jgi:superfamily II DNA or RNA helicase